MELKASKVHWEAT